MHKNGHQARAQLTIAFYLNGRMQHFPGYLMYFLKEKMGFLMKSKEKTIKNYNVKNKTNK